MTIYGHIWLKLICQHAFWPFIGFKMIARTKNWSKLWQKHRFLPPPKSWISNLVPYYYYETSSMTIYGDKWLKLICHHVFCNIMRFRVISRAQDWWKIFQICKFWLLESWILIWNLNIVQRHLQWLSMVIYDWNWYASMRFDLL